MNERLMTESIREDSLMDDNLFPPCTANLGSSSRFVPVDERKEREREGLTIEQSYCK
jgi:hypothetical protein